MEGILRGFNSLYIRDTLLERMYLYAYGMYSFRIVKHDFGLPYVT